MSAKSTSPQSSHVPPPDYVWCGIDFIESARQVTFHIGEAPVFTLTGDFAARIADILLFERRMSEIVDQASRQALDGRAPCETDDIPALTVPVLLGRLPTSLPAGPIQPSSQEAVRRDALETIGEMLGALTQANAASSPEASVVAEETLRQIARFLAHEESEHGFLSSSDWIPYLAGGHVLHDVLVTSDGGKAIYASDWSTYARAYGHLPACAVFYRRVETPEYRTMSPFERAELSWFDHQSRNERHDSLDYSSIEPYLYEKAVVIFANPKDPSRPVSFEYDSDTLRIFMEAMDAPMVDRDLATGATVAMFFPIDSSPIRRNRR